MITAIVHADKEWGIGKGNDMMFSLPKDMKFYDIHKEIKNADVSVEKVIVDLIEHENSTDGEKLYSFVISNLDLGEIFEGEQYAHYSGPISFVFEEGILTDTWFLTFPEHLRKE